MCNVHLYVGILYMYLYMYNVHVYCMVRCEFQSHLSAAFSLEKGVSGLALGCVALSSVSVYVHMYMRTCHVCSPFLLSFHLLLVHVHECPLLHLILHVSNIHTTGSMQFPLVKLQETCIQRDALEEKVHVHKKNVYSTLA